MGMCEGNTKVGLLMRQNILAHIPPSCQEFREIIVITKSIPCFKCGETLDITVLSITAVGRDVEQNCTCIRNDKSDLNILYASKIHLDV